MHQNFDYEPSTHHTYESFKARQEARALRAKFEANTIEGSVISERDEPAAAEPAQLGFDRGDMGVCDIDVFEEAPGG